MTTDTLNPAGLNPAQPGKRLNGKRVLISALLALLVVAAVDQGWRWWTTGRFIETTDDAYVGGDITVVSTKVSGYITEMTVQDNQSVHAGDVIARLDDRDYKAALAQADGAVAAQQAALANLVATRHLQDANIAQAQAGVAAAAAELRRTRDDQTRYQALLSKAVVSEQTAQKADADYQSAQAATQKAQAVLNAAQRQRDVIDTQQQQVQAALAQAQAARNIASLNLGYTVLRAPIDGTIGNRRARNGAFASAGSALLSIVPAQGLWVDANFKENQLTRFQPGQRATVEADALPGRVLHGTLASLAPATGAQFSVLPPENATGNFTRIVQRVPVRILLDQKDAALGRLRPGLSVTADVDVRQ